MGQKNRFFYIGMALGFVLAFAILWFAMPLMQQYMQKMAGEQPAVEQQVAPVVPAPDAVEQDGMTRFLKAAADGDFAVMQSEGRRIFTPGKAIPDSAALLAPYQVNSHPPYLVYAFLTENTEKATRRVLLTMDGQDRVESFLAEEMAVVP